MSWINSPFIKSNIYFNDLKIINNKVQASCKICRKKIKYFNIFIKVIIISTILLFLDINIYKLCLNFFHDLRSRSVADDHRSFSNDRRSRSRSGSTIVIVPITAYNHIYILMNIYIVYLYI